MASVLGVVQAAMSKVRDGTATEEPRVTHDELVLMSALAKLNQRIAQFVMGFLDADTGTPEYALSPEDEQALGAQMIDLGEQIQKHDRGRSVVVEAFHSE
jgi:hypothetical protein